MIVAKTFTFDSAHRLDGYDGPCSRMHGHTWTLRVSVKGDVAKNGFVIDFLDLERIVRESVISRLDHTTINDIIAQPTAENIAIWIWGELKDKLNLYEIELFETKDSSATYRGE